MTLLLHRQTGELHPKMLALMESIAVLIEAGGVDAWFECDLTALLGDEADHYEKVTDIVDVWFESGVSQYCVLQQRPDLRFPADLYLEGSDQHRGWFQTSLLTSLAMRDQAPFKTVLTHGYVVDGKGLKMSKSVGNVVLPADVVKNLGADVLRLWAASTDHTNDINVSNEILQRSSDAYRRIRNTVRFLLSNLDDFDPTRDAVSATDMVELDRWIIATTLALQEKIIAAYECYHFQAIYQMIHNFCSVELGSFYLDVIKDRQYTAKKDSVARRSSQTALYHIAEALVRWIAPILSFTAEEIWQHMPGARAPSVFLSEWYTKFPNVLLPSKDYWPWFMGVRDEVNKVLEAHRSKGEIGSALDAEVVLYGDTEFCEKLLRLGDELRFALITSSVRVLPLAQANGQATETVWGGLQVQVQVSDHVKCVRCWQRREEVSVNKAYEGLCQRCITNISGRGEERHYA